MTDQELADWQKQKAAEEQAAGARMFMGLPDRWYEKPGPLWRCANDHVIRWYLKSEELGNVCPRCRRAVALTFPEDHE